MSCDMLFCSDEDRTLAQQVEGIDVSTCVRALVCDVVRYDVLRRVTCMLHVVCRMLHVQVILGGHDHEPVTLMERTTLICKAGQNANWLGVVDLDVELVRGAHATTHIHPSWTLACNRGYTPDSNIQSIIQRYQAEKEEAQKHVDLDAHVAVVGMSDIKDGEDDMYTRMDDLAKEMMSGTATQLPRACPPITTPSPPLITRSADARRHEIVFACCVADGMWAHYASDDGCHGAVINGGFVRGDKSYPVGTRLSVRDIYHEVSEGSMMASTCSTMLLCVHMCASCRAICSTCACMFHHAWLLHVV